MDSRLRYQRSEGRASAPPRPNGRDHDAPDEPRFPEHLTAIWDALSAGLRGLIIGPWDGRNLNQRKRIGDCVTGLRDAGWTLDDCAAVAPRAADGLDKNSHHKTLIPEIWAEISGRRLDGPDFSADRAASRRPADDEKRVFVVGYTGLGKTMLGLAMAVGMAMGIGFLDWRTGKSVRVLYIDGEMPDALMRDRITDAVRRRCCEGRPDEILFAYSADDGERPGEAGRDPCGAWPRFRRCRPDV
jgi:AAA domain